jgi:hypothetical protein
MAYYLVKHRDNLTFTSLHLISIKNFVWEDNIKTNLKELGSGLNSVGLASRPFVSSCEYDGEISGPIKGGKFFD